MRPLGGIEKDDRHRQILWIYDCAFCQAVGYEELRVHIYERRSARHEDKGGVETLKDVLVVGEVGSDQERKHVTLHRI